MISLCADNLECFGAALGCMATGSEAIMPRPVGERMVEHLQGPLTVSSIVPLATNTIMSVKKRDRTTSLEGESLMLQQFAQKFK